MLFELIYRSKAKEGISEQDINDILNTARQFNQENNLTGCLLFHENQFLQTLEGEFDIINRLYAKIRIDARHHNVVTLHMKEIDYRIYSDWTMAFKSLEGEGDVKKRVGVTEFTALESVDGLSPISKKLFGVISQEILQ